MIVCSKLFLTLPNLSVIYRTRCSSDCLLSRVLYLNECYDKVKVDFGEESGGTAPCNLLRLRGHIQDEGERVSAARFIGGLCLCMHVYMCV